MSLEANPSKEQKNAAVFAKRISWRKIAITPLTVVTARSTTNARHKRKESLLWMLHKSFVCRAKIDPKDFDKLKPDLQLCFEFCPC